MNGLTSAQMMILFGWGPPSGPDCYSDRIYMDAWSYDLRALQWTELNRGSTPWDSVNHRWSSVQPSERYLQAAILTEIGIVVFGGHGQTTVHNDTWGFDIGER